MSTTDIVLEELAKIAGTDEIRQNLDIPLFDEQILDSLGVLELIVSLGDIFQIELTPATVDRKLWATPRKIISDIETRLNH